jgi:DNA-binding response OmpR family regulator
MAALEHLRGGNFGIVFLDYNMPGKSGFDTLADIQREHANVAVVMMSSTSSKAITDRALSLGALGCLKKPFYPADVDAMLERFFGIDVPRG